MRLELAVGYELLDGDADDVGGDFERSDFSGIDAGIQGRAARSEEAGGFGDGAVGLAFEGLAGLSCFHMHLACLLVLAFKAHVVCVAAGFIAVPQPRIFRGKGVSAA